VDPAVLPFDKVVDSATRSVLRRFAEESRIGQFGIYFGNESGGEVRRLSKKG